MSRIKQETISIERVVEAVSPQIKILWNPETNDGEVAFEVWDMVTDNGVYKGLQLNTEVKTANDPISTIRLPLSNVLQRVLTINLPGGGTTQIPAALLMLAIKKLFDDAYLERVDELHPQPTPEPTPEVTPEPTPEP